MKPGMKTGMETADAIVALIAENPTIFLASPYGLFAHDVRGFCACARPRKRGGATIAGAIGMRLFAFVMMPGGITRSYHMPHLDFTLLRRGMRK